MDPNDVIKHLNRLIDLDPCAVRTLLEARSLLNPDLKAAAEGFTFKSADGTTYIRPLGLLNTALKPLGVTIAAKYDADGNPTQFLLVEVPTE
jgi:hypothetical protein